MGNQSSGSTTMAIVALVLGILGFIGCGCITGIPAWIIGRNEVANIERGASPVEGKTMAQIGMWLGIITTVLTIIGVIIGLVFPAMILGLVGLSGTTQ